MKKNGINSSQGPLNGVERSSYHHSGLPQQDRRCDNCKYKVALNECQQFKCKDCGTYIICDYCYEEYMEKNDYSEAQYEAVNSLSSADRKKDLNQLMGQYQKLSCVYCSSRHSLTDICVKTLKSFGFIPPKGSNKILISTLSKEKIKKLANLRVIQKTLVYVIGIAPEIASEDILKAPEYFGQYGDLTKVVVNTNNVYNATRGGPSYSAYLTYSHARESAIAILAVDQHQLHERVLRASFGTSKFCQFFMNGQKCTNKDCLYLHEIKVDLEAYTKEDMQNNKFIFQEQQKIAIKLSRALEFTIEEFRDYNRANNKNLPPENVKFEPKLPSPDTIYYKDFHFLDEPLINRKHIRTSNNNASTSSTNNSNNNGDIKQNGTGATITNQQTSTSVPLNTTGSNNLITENSANGQSGILMTLSNQKDLNNQTDRNLSKNRIISSVSNNNNINNNVQNKTNGTATTKQLHQTQNSNLNDTVSASDASDEEAKRRQIEAIEELVDGKKSEKHSVQLNSQLNGKPQKKNTGKNLSLDNSTDTAPITQSKLETPKESNAMTSTRKIFDLSAQNAKGKENLDGIQNESAPTLNKQSSYQGALINSLDQLVLAQVNNKKVSDVSTISKTPPHNDNQFMMQVASYIISPMLFRKKQESRFQFAHSVDPIKSNGDDWDEIEVPAKIQDLIERNIRTLSNSLSSKNEVYQEVALEIKDLREKWLTKQEKLLENQDQLRNRKNDLHDMSSLEDNRLLKFKQKKTDGQTAQNDPSGKQIYNLTEHSQNIRVKISRQNSKENLNQQDGGAQTKGQQMSSSQIGQQQQEEQTVVENSSNSATFEDGKSSSRTSSLVQQARGTVISNKQVKRRRKEEKRSDIHNFINNKVRN